MSWYESNLGTIVKRLKQETDARLALLSLAVIGEDLEHEANRKVNLYNEVVRRVAREENIAYLPLHRAHGRLSSRPRRGAGQLPPRLEYRDGLHNTGNALALHATGLSWDEVSRRNGLLVTTDGLHLNSVGAGMIADLIEAWLIQV